MIKLRTPSQKFADLIRFKYYNGTYKDKEDLLPVILEIAEDYKRKTESLDISMFGYSGQKLEVNLNHGLTPNQAITDMLRKKKKAYMQHLSSKRRVRRIPGAASVELQGALKLVKEVNG